MSKRIWRAFRNELTKCAPIKFLYLGIALSAALPFFCTVGFEQMGADSRFSGFSFITNSTQVALTSLIPVFVLIFACLLVASESVYGTYRDVLSRPVGRGEFLAAKLLVLFLYLLILVFANCIVTLIFAKLKYGVDAIVEDGEVLVSTGHFFYNLFVAYLIVLFPLFAVGAFGFFISALSRTLVGAIGFALGIYLGIEPLKFLIPVGNAHLDKYLFSSYLDVPFGVLNDLASGVEISWNNPKVHWCIGLSALYIILFVALSFGVFLTRDING